MPSEKDNILKFNQHMKFDKMPYVIYADLESLTKKKKVDTWSNNLKKSPTIKIGERIPCGYGQFDNIENNHILYCRGKSLYFFKRICYECN